MLMMMVMTREVLSYHWSSLVMLSLPSNELYDIPADIVTLISYIQADSLQGDAPLTISNKPVTQLIGPYKTLKV